MCISGKINVMSENREDRLNASHILSHTHTHTHTTHTHTESVLNVMDVWQILI